MPLKLAKTGTVLAFDFGEKRIGVAVGELAAGIAHPLTTISAADNRSRFAAIAALIDEWQPDMIVVGRPLHTDGSEHEMTARAHPSYTGGSAEARQRRDLLRRAMESNGFTVEPNEWWHFNYRDWQQYPILDIPFAAASK